MTEKIKTLLLSKNEDDNIIGVILLKQNSEDWYDFFGELNSVVGYSYPYYIGHGNSYNMRYLFKYNEHIADVPFKEEI